MSDEDKSEKTEEPTSKRLQDARDKGQVATSKEVNTWMMLAAGTGLVMLAGPAVGRDLMNALARFIFAPHEMSVDLGSLLQAMWSISDIIGVTMGLIAGVLMVTAMAGGLMQHGIVLSAESLKPDITKLSLIKGVKRMFSLKALAEFLKGIIKLILVASVVIIVLLPESDRLTSMVGQETERTLDDIYVLSLKILVAVVIAMGFIAIADFAYQKHEFLKQQRMSKREIKDEYKQVEGDPMVKARLRSIRMDRARRRMMAAVPDASVVITNPTHYAVALKYDEKEMEAPVVVAKGADLVAQKIREIAKENNIPITENPPLARALFASVEVDQMIPADQYKAVAEIISYVWRLKNKSRARPAGAA